MEQVVIIGNGISGITAARHIRKRSNCKISVISPETPYFFSRTALMYVYMGHLKFAHTKPYEDSFWKKNRIDVILDQVVEVNVDKKSLGLRSGQNLGYDKLIIATGSSPNSLNMPGEHLGGVQSLYSLQDLERMETNTLGIREAVIIGGGLIGVEMAEMLRSRDFHVTMVVREQAFWNNVLPLQEAKMISRHISSHGVNLMHGEELAAIIPDDNGKVKAIQTRSGQQIRCQFLGITVGVNPNVSFLQNSAININRGILVDKYLQTNIPDIYAVGDCVERLYNLEGRKSIEQVWYTARMMGETVAHTVCGDPTPYEPGPWFNSAKFFDIEFQAYGNVSSKLNEGESAYYWEHPAGKKAIRIVWRSDDHRFLGINAFGIRLRHERFDRWLREKRSVGFIIEHLREANFDPEFSERHEHEIMKEFSESAMTNQR